MRLEEQVYSVLVVSAAEPFNSALSTMLPEAAFSPVHFVSSIRVAKQVLAQRDFDFVLINSPLPDDPGIRFATDLCTAKGTVILLLVRSDIHDDIRDRVVKHGVFTLPKPISRSVFFQALSWMASARERLRKFETSTLSIEDKMEEIRLTNRAKWLLIDQRQMDEPQAHRYIEKQAMDRCISKRAVAQEIIQMYTSSSQGSPYSAGSSVIAQQKSPAD